MIKILELFGGIGSPRKALDDGNGFPKKINVELEIPIKL